MKKKEKNETLQLPGTFFLAFNPMAIFHLEAVWASVLRLWPAFPGTLLKMAFLTSAFRKPAAPKLDCTDPDTQHWVSFQCRILGMGSDWQSSYCTHTLVYSSVSRKHDTSWNMATGNCPRSLRVWRAGTREQLEKEARLWTQATSASLPAVPSTHLLWSS